MLDVLKKPVSPEYEEIVRTVQERLGSTPKQAHFVASLSEKDDLLSQWRAYCPPGAGVSIGFPSNVLEDQWIANPRPGDPFFLGASLQKVRYLSPDHQKELQAFIERLFALEQKECSGAERYYPNSSVLAVVSPLFDKELIPEEEQKPLVEIALESIRQAEGGMLAPRLNTPGETTAAWAINFAPFVKHEAFKEECEWRKLISKDSRVMPAQKFRRGKSTLVPFVEIMLDVTRLEAQAVPRKEYFIEEVVVGPTPTPELTLEALHALFESEGHPEVRLRLSRIPFRDW